MPAGAIAAAVLAAGCGAGATAASTSGPGFPTKPAKAARSSITWGVTPAPGRHRLTRLHLPTTPRAGILVDANTGEVMWSARPWYRVPIASLTKMMTALVALDRARPSTRLTVSQTAAAASGSTVPGLEAGAVLHVDEMLRGLLIVSGNDMAIALAEGLGPGTAGFVRRMNQKAKAMRLGCTRYVEPIGLDRRNVSCAHDLALLARSILRDRHLAPIVGRAWDTIPIGGGRTALLRNRNPLIRSGYPGIDGVKTGHTIPAGWSLAASAKRGRMRLIAVLLAEDENAMDMRLLLDAGFRALSKG